MQSAYASAQGAWAVPAGKGLIQPFFSPCSPCRVDENESHFILLSVSRDCSIILFLVIRD